MPSMVEVGKSAPTRDPFRATSGFEGLVPAAFWHADRAVSRVVFGLESHGSTAEDRLL